MVKMKEPSFAWYLFNNSVKGIYPLNIASISEITINLCLCDKKIL